MFLPMGTTGDEVLHATRPKPTRRAKAIRVIGMTPFPWTKAAEFTRPRGRCQISHRQGPALEGEPICGDRIEIVDVERVTLCSGPTTQGAAMVNKRLLCSATFTAVLAALYLLGLYVQHQAHPCFDQWDVHLSGYRRQ